ncbi:MAG: hypothetical protein JWO82_61 [Akkermansiaceae bacterium]|nr:hypothetical protein [Akkermansiaceae bacterium]
MRFLTEYHGSREPEIVFVGEPQDFLELATSLEEKIHLAVQTGQLEGPLDLPGLQVDGSTRLSFGLTGSSGSRTLPVAKQHSCLRGVLIWITGLATLYFFCRGFDILFF